MIALKLLYVVWTFSILIHLGWCLGRLVTHSSHHGWRSVFAAWSVRDMEVVGVFTLSLAAYILLFYV